MPFYYEFVHIDGSFYHGYVDSEQARSYPSRLQAVSSVEGVFIEHIRNLKTQPA